MLKRIGIGLVIVGAMALPAAAGAALSPSDYKNTSKFCKALKSDMGAALFRQTYGTNASRSNAHGKCVSRNVHAVDRIHSNAAKQCKDERTADPTAFDDKYGTGKKKSNALGRCVRQAAQTLTQDRVDAVTNAAKACKAERADDAAAFRDKYGTNHNKRNAFGKCVSQKVKSTA